MKVFLRPRRHVDDRCFIFGYCRRMTLDNWIAFCAACLALAAVPGPTVTVIIANSLRFGPRAGLLNVAGTQAGVAIWLVIAAFGLGAAIKVMGFWFDILRYAGAAYLVWIGLKMLFAKGKISDAAKLEQPKGSFFFQGFIVILSNPKMLVLFGALIPPFVQPEADGTSQVLLLGFSFAVIACITDAFYALAAGQAGRWLSQSRVRGIEIVSGLCLTLGGLWLALKHR